MQCNDTKDCVFSLFITMTVSIISYLRVIEKFMFFFFFFREIYMLLVFTLVVILYSLKVRRLFWSWIITWDYWRFVCSFQRSRSRCFWSRPASPRKTFFFRSRKLGWVSQIHYFAVFFKLGLIPILDVWLWSSITEANSLT